MTEQDRSVGSTLPRRQLGRYLLEWRTSAGLTREKAAQLLEMGATSLRRLEKGENGRIKARDIRAACDLYGVPDDLVSALVGLAKQANVKSWWHQYGDVIPKDFNVYVGLEAAAVEITSYQTNLVPGLLQTADYDRTLVRLAWPDETGEEREHRVGIKMHRQNVVTRTTQPLRLDVVIGEPALHQVVGNAAIMGTQLRHLADMSTRPNISLRVLPFESGFPGGRSMPPFVILDFGETSLGEPVEPRVVFLEGVVGDLYLERGGDVKFFEQGYDLLGNAALDDVRSRDLLRKLAREYQNGR